MATPTLFWEMALIATVETLEQSLLVQVITFPGTLKFIQKLFFF